MTPLKFQIWTLEPLPKKARCLAFPAYPFANGQTGPLPESISKMFEALKIIYYRDESEPFGICYTPEGSDQEIDQRTGFLAYKYSGICDMDTMTMVRWTPARSPVQYKKVVARHGDDYAWYIWERAVTVINMNEERIETA